MADEDEQKQQGAGDGSSGKSGGKLKFIMIPIILIAQLVGAYFIVFNYLLVHPNRNEEPQKKKESLQVGQFYELDDIVVNPAGTGGKRFLVVEIGFESKIPEVITEAESKDIWIRDAIITILTTKGPEELMDFSRRQDLRMEILSTINRKMLNGKFENLYFKKYIMQ
jgi:flagellar FliL protein